MKVFIARQPIYDRNRNVFGYELLYRNNQMNNSAIINNELATADVLVNSFLNFGIEELTNNKLAFVNFTERLLLDHVPENFPPKDLVIEILETVKPTEQIMEACSYYKELGYQIALDDFIFDERNPDCLKLLPFANFIKVDFRSTTRQTRKKIAQLKKFFPVQLLAEKVETVEEFNEAYQSNFDLFQGYFFTKPIILTKNEIPILFHSYIGLMQELENPEPNIEVLTKIIENDLSLSYKLLKAINKNFYKWNEIKSVKQAIVLLGLKEIKNWIYIISIRESSKERNDQRNEVLTTSIIRGKFCEFFAKTVLRVNDPSAYFLTGMFSLIDTVLHMSMTNILQNLPLEKEIKLALLGKHNDYKEVLDLILFIEKAQWTEVTRYIRDYKLKEEQLTDIYMNAVKWANQLNN
ncbi:EAL and HDOD domain-containing protein [Bacillus kwashiorkori]|uniref:EAL and HDOD domain-containing protein n=1 Tax=Bacillus kwashiorkori TaxID=1522318 RepID=UPI000782DB5C|nr:EAL domain-containing protein [Bacillus kwashiorkori]